LADGSEQNAATFFAFLGPLEPAAAQVRVVDRRETCAECVRGTQVKEMGSAAGQQQRSRAGRPERVIDPTDGPLSNFAHALREARAAAGYPTYRALARRALFAPSVLSTAASGMVLPTLQVTLAYARACGADASEWRQRWEAVAAELASSRDRGGREHLSAR
jgi:ribosome-binding protein aMBF1 (putative translation factor)